MRKYFLALTFLLFATSVIAQKKNKREKAPPLIKKEEVLPDPIKEARTQNDVEYLVVVPESSLMLIDATTIKGEKLDIANLKELESLNLSQFKELSIITRISNKSLDVNLFQKILDEATQLEILTIDNFAIESFPEIKMPNNHLKRLNLNRNNLKKLDSSISNLIALEDFSSSNPLQELPETFSELKNLKELGLSYTEFSEFPKVIFELNKLTVLYVSGNFKANKKIKEIPDLFQKLPNLKELGVTDALLSELPKSISTLKKLEKVNFSDNQFSDFPEVLATNPNLQYVPFANNPLDWDKFKVSIKKVKWNALFFINGTGFTKKQYEEIQKMLPKTDVYYDGMND